MKPKIEVGQWWEDALGQRVRIVGITSQIPGIKEIRKQPVVGVVASAACKWYSIDGQFSYVDPSAHDLTTLLPPECNSFDWKPEPEWRDARPEDVQHPTKLSRFRITGTVNWEKPCQLVGTVFRCDGKRLWVTDDGHHFGECQVQEDTCK